MGRKSRNRASLHILVNLSVTAISTYMYRNFKCNFRTSYNIGQREWAIVVTTDWYVHVYVVVKREDMVCVCVCD